MTKRRLNNDGSITKRTDGRWEARVSLPDGKRKSLYGKTRQEVQQKLKQAQRDVDDGLPIVSDKQSLADYLHTWLKTAKHTIDPSSWDSYETNVRLHLIPALGRIPLSKLAALHIQSFYADKLDEGLSATYVRHFHAVLHRALEDAMRMGLVQQNVADLVQRPRKERKEMMVFSDDEAKRFLECLPGQRFEALYILAVTTGMRRCELLGLRWQDINIGQKSLQIQVALQCSKNRWYLAEPKSKYSRRRIALSKLALEALQQHRLRQVEERLALGEAWDKTHDLVFPNSLGKIMAPNSLGGIDFPRLLKRFGLPKIRFHDLRHTCATLLLSRGLNPKIVSEMLGHASVAITLDIYSHVTPHMQQAAADIMDAALG